MIIGCDQITVIIRSSAMGDIQVCGMKAELMRAKHVADRTLMASMTVYRLCCNHNETSDTIRPGA